MKTEYTAEQAASFLLSDTGLSEWQIGFLAVPCSLADKQAASDTLIGKCTTSLPFKFEFDPKDNGHYLMFGSTREGMSIHRSFLQKAVA